MLEFDNNMDFRDHLAVNRTNLANERTLLSYARTALTLFIVGSARTLITRKVWWRSGLEMLFIGAIAATIAYVVGFLLDQLIS